MPFPWMQADVPASYQATYRDKALDMYRAEIKQRAELLRHLGFSAKEATARCRENLRWDFDMGGHCPIEDEVQKIVQAVYRRKG
jgi:hypothetical protein